MGAAVPRGVVLTGRGVAVELEIVASPYRQVEAVLPEVVSIDRDGLRAVDYGKLNALLIEAVKAQQRLIDEQGAALDALRAENAEIREALGLR